MRRVVRLAVLTLAVTAGAARGGGDRPRIGVLAPADEEGQAAAAAFVETWNAGTGAEGDFVQRVVARGEKETAAALEDLHRENVRLIAAFGDAATTHVRDSVRDVDVVFATQDAALALELRRGGGACVVSSAGPDVVAANLRRAVKEFRRAAVYVPESDEAAAANAVELGGEIEIVLAEGVGATPDERAASAVAKAAADADAVWLPPSVGVDDAVAVAKALAKRGLPLVGSRRSHLAAGCAIVVRADAADLGAHAAVLAHRLSSGADPGKTPMRRARRSLVEVNLPAAARLGFSVPLTVLAWADEIWPRAGKGRL
jgi:ABC-type uncharacterized transport system substrate-binding protein